MIENPNKLREDQLREACKLVEFYVRSKYKDGCFIYFGDGYIQIQVFPCDVAAKSLFEVLKASNG